MQPKHNKQLLPLAKQLRKEMTKEERHLWYDFLRSYPVRTSTKRILPVKNLTGRINCFTDTRQTGTVFVISYFFQTGTQRSGAAPRR